MMRLLKRRTDHRKEERPASCSPLPRIGKGGLLYSRCELNCLQPGTSFPRAGGGPAQGLAILPPGRMGLPLVRSAARASGFPSSEQLLSQELFRTRDFFFLLLLHFHNITVPGELPDVLSRQGPRAEGG